MTAQAWRALSLSRPWTTLVLRQGKDIENRTWSTSYRGPLVIHGALSFDRAAYSWDIFVHGSTELSGYERDHPTGLLGTVELVDICDGQPCSCGPWAMPGQKHWRLANPRPFPEPIPCGGALRLWNVPADLAADIPSTTGGAP